MWSLVPEVVSYGEYTSGKRVAGIINAIMGGSSRLVWLWVVSFLVTSTPLLASMVLSRFNLLPF